jgi:hypothetical protein
MGRPVPVENTGSPHSARIANSLFHVPERSMKHLCRAVAFAITIFLGVSSGSAQETCLLYQQGTVGCPNYGAPAATAVPGPSMASNIGLGAPTAVTLFNGATPPNGFMVRIFVQSTLTPPYGYPNNECYINDNGTAAASVGFYMTPDANGYTSTFITPVGYKPIGPVSVFCRIINSTGYLAARGW